MLINQLDQRLDAVIGERQDLFIALSINPRSRRPRCPSLWRVRVASQRPRRDRPRDAVDGHDMINFVNVHDQAASAGRASAARREFHGSNS